MRKSKLIIGILAATMASATLANGLNEDGSYQFRNSNAQMVLLNKELARLKKKNNGFQQVFNVHGAEAVYMGNNSQTWVDGDQINNTSVGNMTEVEVTGDGNDVNVGQDNDGDQGSETNQIGNGGRGDDVLTVGSPIFLPVSG